MPSSCPLVQMVWFVVTLDGGVLDPVNKCVKHGVSKDQLHGLVRNFLVSIQKLLWLDHVLVCAAFSSFRTKDVVAHQLEQAFGQDSFPRSPQSWERVPHSQKAWPFGPML